MRVLLGLLIVLNAVILLWGRNMSATLPSTKHHSILPPTGVSGIVLARELEAEVPTEKSKEPPAVIAQEVLSQEQPANVEKSAETEEIPDTWQPEPVCGRIGPFVSQLQLDRFLGTTELIASKVEQLQAPSASSKWWVLIPPLADRNKSHEMVTRLKQAGFADVWLFSSGDMKNFISLGLFSSKENATKQLMAVNRAGFQAEIRKREEGVNQWWLDFQALPGKVGQRNLPDGVQLEKKTCH